MHLLSSKIHQQVFCKNNPDAKICHSAALTMIFWSHPIILLGLSYSYIAADRKYKTLFRIYVVLKSTVLFVVFHYIT